MEIPHYSPTTTMVNRLRDDEVKPHVEDSPNNTSDIYFEKQTSDGKIELTEDAAPEVLGFAWSTRKKW